MKETTILVFLLFILTGCIDNGPSDEELEKAIEASLNQSVPVFIVGNMLGGQLKRL